MVGENIKGIGNIQPNEQKGPASPRSDGVNFQRLLEKLEDLARPPKVDGKDPDSPEVFEKDLRKADDDFASVMDLRHRLEEAFRRSRE